MAVTKFAKGGVVYSVVIDEALIEAVDGPAPVEEPHDFPSSKQVIAGLSKYPHVLQKVDFGSNGDYDEESESGREECGIDDANAITSRVVGTEQHTVMLDLDVPARLVPSSTEGHFHLYVDVEMSWKKYLKLLKVLAEVGVLEEGYVSASSKRGHTTLRLPWCHKGDD